MKRSPNYTKKLVLDHGTVRELRLGELERITGGGDTGTTIVVIGAPVPPPEKKPDDEYEITC